MESLPRDPARFLVTFVWRPPTAVTAASVYTPLADFGQRETDLRPLGRTGVWYRSFRLPRGTRATYGFSPRSGPLLTASEEEWARFFGSIRADPLNPNHIRAGPSQVFSVFELPGAPRQPWDKVRGASRWHEEHHRIRSRKLRNVRSVWVSLPGEFDPDRVRYNLLVVFDGEPYRDPIPTGRIVEYLVGAGRIPPTIVVLVGNPPGARASDLHQNPEFPEFLAHELLPWLYRRYRIRTDAAHTVLAGSSLGAVAATHAALRHPELFGKILAQSGSFLPISFGGTKIPRSLMEQFAHARRRPIRFYLEAGTFERIAMDGAPASLLGSVRHMRDVLVAKGYPVAYAEFEGGHDFACWRATFARGLVELLGRRTRSRRRTG